MTILNVWGEGREETVTRVTPVIRRVIGSQERRAKETPKAIIRSQEVLSNAKGGGYVLSPLMLHPALFRSSSLYYQLPFASQNERDKT